MDRIITSYEKPDLDGVSTMYAYAEYLNKIGTKSSYYVWGVPKKEVAIVCDMFNISLEGVTSIEENQSEEKIEEIFTLKSKIEDKDLRVEMEAEIALNYNNEKITIAQLEVANMEDFLKEKEDKIVKILSQIKQEKNLDYIVINCVDILNGFNIILTISDKEEQLFNKIFGYEFKNRRCKINKIMQRKDLTKAIREASIND